MAIYGITWDFEDRALTILSVEENGFEEIRRYLAVRSEGEIRVLSNNLSDISLNNERGVVHRPSLLQFSCCPIKLFQLPYYLVYNIYYCVTNRCNFMRIDREKGVEII